MAERRNHDPDDLKAALLAPPALSAATTAPAILHHRINADSLGVIRKSANSPYRKGALGSLWSTSQNPMAWGDQGPRAKANPINAYGLRVADEQVWNLLREMPDRDLTIALSIRRICAKVSARPQVFSVAPHHPWKARAAELAKPCELYAKSPRGNFGWIGLINSAVEGVVIEGTAIIEIQWEARAGLTVPRNFVQRHPGEFQWDEDGNLCFGAAFPGGIAGERVPEGKFIVLRAPSPFGNPWGKSTLWPVRWLYEIKKLAMLGWIEFSDSSGAPFLVVKVPEGVQDQDGVAARVQSALEDMRGGDGGLVLPLGIEIDTVDRLKGGGVIPQQNVVDWADEQILKYMDGSTLSTEAAPDGGGSRAASSVHADSADVLIPPIAAIVSEGITRGYCDAFAAINGGELMRGSIVFKVDCESGRDLKASIDAANAAKALDLGQTKEEAREWLGIREAEPGEETIEAGAAPMFPAPGGGGGTGSPFGFSRRFRPRTDIHFAARPSARQRQAEAQWLNERLRAIGGALREDNVAAYVEALRAAVRADTVGKPPDAKISREQVLAARVVTPAEVASGVEAVAAARGLAYLQTYRAVNAVIEGVGALPAATEIAPAYKAAAEWMVNRGVADKATVAEMSKAVAALEGSLPTSVERLIRQDVLALAKSPAPEITRLYQEALGSVVAEGGTFGEFAAKMDAALGKGALPESFNGYLETVYRTETGNAYSRQSALAAKDPDIADFVWGREFHNARLPSSRVSHVAMDGVQVRKGSPADAALGQDPPWSFNCTCVGILLLAPDPENSEYAEPSDALAKVNALERFDS